MSMPIQMPIHGKRPLAVDLSHHINTLSRSRLPSPLKDLLKCEHLPVLITLLALETESSSDTFEPGMISFAGG